SIDLIMQMGSRVLGKSEEHGRALRLLGRVALAEGDWAAAGQHLEKSAAMFRASGTRLEQGRTLVELGRLALARGDASSAGQSLQSALNIFQDLGAKADERVAAKLLAGPRLQ
ncbi:MAG: tetratricopeptide repeat protein, partial [Anaerolineales bacterium]